MVNGEVELASPAHPLGLVPLLLLGHDPADVSDVGVAGDVLLSHQIEHLRLEPGHSHHVHWPVQPREYLPSLSKYTSLWRAQSRAQHAPPDRGTQRTGDDLEIDPDICELDIQ